jgi:CRP-like cAMP-binding protein
MTDERSLRRAATAAPTASPAAEQYAAELIERAADIRLTDLAKKPGATGDRALYRSKARRSIQVVAIETVALREDELLAVMRFRLAQYLVVRFVDLDRIHAERIEYEPLDHAGPHDVHLIALDTTTGEILCYVTIKKVAGVPPDATFRTRTRPLLPVEEVHGWGIFNRLERLPDIPIDQVREVGRFVKNQRYHSLDERSIRAPIETSLALWHVTESKLPGVQVLVGDFEEGIAQARLAYFHVPMAVLHGTVPYEAETAWLFRRYQHRTVFPFAVLIEDLPVARSRGKSIDRALSLPGKLALIRLSYLRGKTSPHRSSLEPKGGLPAIDEALVLRQPDVAMADRLLLIHEGDNLRLAPLFADLSVAEAAVLGTLLHRQEVAPGETILHEGDAGDALFVVESGTVVVRTGDLNLAELGPGDHFGEIALVTGGTRTADVIAPTGATVLRLDRHVYLEYLAALPDILQKTAATSAARLAASRDQATATTEPTVFGELASADMSVLGTHMTRRDVREGEVIVRQGEPGDALYMVVSGEAEVAAHATTGARHVIATLGPGDFFGEISLLDSVPRIAEVVALTPMKILRLDREGFEKFMRYSETARANLGATAMKRRRETTRALDSRP